MADILATIANIGLFKVFGLILVIGLIIAAFAMSGKKGGSDGSSKKSNNDQTSGGNS